MVSAHDSRNRYRSHVSVSFNKIIPLYWITTKLTSCYRAAFDCTVRLWDSMTGECLKVLADHTRPVYALTFSPDGRWLGTGGGDGWMNIYSVKVVNCAIVSPQLELTCSLLIDKGEEVALVCWPRQTWCLRNCLAADKRHQSHCPGAGTTSSWGD